MAELNPSEQFLLDFPAQARTTFSSFVVTPGCRLAFQAAESFVSNRGDDPVSLYLHGPSGTGKTHLLLAMGNALAAENLTALYLDGLAFARSVISDMETTLADTVQRLVGTRFLLLDNLDAIAGNTSAQEILYQVYNTLKEQGGKIVFAARHAPEHLPETETYLTSRLQWGLVVELAEPDEEALAQIFKKMGETLDLEIPDAVVEFLLLRLPRDIPSLQNAVQRINEESLRERRKVTVPMVKTALNLD